MSLIILDKNNINVILIPANCTDRLQLLDMTMWGVVVMTTCYSALTFSSDHAVVSTSSQGGVTSADVRGDD